MSERIKMDKAEWWKGSLPAWIGALLLAMIAYFGRRELTANDNIHARLVTDVGALQVRVSVLESQYRDIISSLSRIEANQDSMRDAISKLR